MEKGEILRPESERRLKELIRHFPVLVLTGARQAGKTTLLRLTFPNYRYVTLDLPSLADQADNDPELFLRDHASPVIIDEVQYAPKLFRNLKTAIDRDRHHMGAYLLTGSQKFTLMKEVSESLAGRLVWLELENLTVHEILSHFSKEPPALNHILVRGQFPELWRNTGLPSLDFYSSYLATYLERDVRQILNVTNLRDFERFMRILAARNGQILNKSEMAKDVGVSVKAIGDWVGVLEASNQIVLLEPWFQNFGKRIVKSPKVYFRDTGMVSFLLGIDEKSLAASPFSGTLFETFVFSELRKLNHTNPRPYRFWFYRDQRAREIDFVLERDGLLTFMECKGRESVSASDIQQAAVVLEELRLSQSHYRPAQEHFVMSRTSHEHTIAPGFRAVNFSHILKFFEE